MTVGKRRTKRKKKKERYQSKNSISNINLSLSLFMFKFTDVRIPPPPSPTLSEEDWNTIPDERDHFQEIIPHLYLGSYFSSTVCYNILFNPTHLVLYRCSLISNYR